MRRGRGRGRGREECGGEERKDQSHMPTAVTHRHFSVFGHCHCDHYHHPLVHHQNHPQSQGVDLIMFSCPSADAYAG
jgi:hypothetical protein